MKTGKCRCGSRIFFNNHRCLTCHAVLGRCGPCGTLTSFSYDGESSTCDECGSVVFACPNQKHGVCNLFRSSRDALCRLCEFTTVIPPLHKPDAVQRWSAMESAKRRLLLQLEKLELPPFVADLMQSHPLRFKFLENSVDENGKTEHVTTGHRNGVITINLAEADSVHRERLRVELGEPHRTLIGHMRHEVGHYIDWSWANRVAEDEYVDLFGDPRAVDYGEAMNRHYDQGPPPHWENSFVSAYATMHPWEDFAETVNAYLDIMAIATTANDLGQQSLSGGELDLSADADAEQVIQSVLEVVVRVSEYNLDLGLMPLLPERLPPAVIEKLAFVHSLRSRKMPHAGQRSS